MRAAQSSCKVRLAWAQLRENCPRDSEKLQVQASIGAGRIKEQQLAWKDNVDCERSLVAYTAQGSEEVADAHKPCTSRITPSSAKETQQP